jgi:WD40 repeat protein
VVTAVVAGPGGRWTVAGTDGPAVKIWDGRTGAVEATLLGHEKPVTSVALGRDGRVVSSSFDGTLRVWRPKVVQEALTLPGRAGGT